MNSRSTLGIAGATLRAVSIAAALACGAASSFAGSASVNITSFTVSSAEFSGLFAWAVDPFQSYNMSALEAGGIISTKSDIFSADNWNLGLNRLAQTANAKATGNTVNFTDTATQLTTAGFNLSAQATGAYAPPALPNYANASGLQEGSFVLLDENGARAGGTITFDVYYDMNVSTPGSTAATYSQTQLNFDLSADGLGNANKSFVDGLLSNSLAGGTGSVSSGHFSWTYTLGAGDAAYYTLSGSAVASAGLPVAAIPEPETYALMLLGLAGIGTVARRSRAGAERGNVVA